MKISHNMVSFFCDVETVQNYDSSLEHEKDSSGMWKLVREHEIYNFPFIQDE